MVRIVEEILDYPCSCGGKLKKSFCSVEFFGHDFGERACEICTSCGSEFLSDQTVEEIECEVKKRKLFGLEKQVTVVKSGNSLVFRIPPEIAKFLKIHPKKIARMFPLDEKRLAIELSG
ncbi:hypothetical protein HYV79_02890 [Candidatus Woesearchaeota archaeon]|nr:hypothetical protein [Candidatus Woesearchaeota archaeon]